ncbi:hypothetical protein EXIGLDRAFT_723404 [Exidia glandulosa HHB12029]|uniref:Uncharacterized protein n=1 Tax=Exidia glandulosa HHB12029 TaxID=1314781 RepID=A0A165EUI9_EXIGL|nr:hypothetical protein EXIGLDRAFT_723404 [Exidia glandulosa HHB12029]
MSLVLFCSAFVVFVWLLLALCGKQAEVEASDQIEKGQFEKAQDIQEIATTRDSAIRILFMVWCTAVILLSIAGQVFFFLPQDDQPQPVTILKRLSVIKFMFVHQFLSVVSATLLIFCASFSIFGCPGLLQRDLASYCRWARLWMLLCAIVPVLSVVCPTTLESARFAANYGGVPVHVVYSVQSFVWILFLWMPCSWLHVRTDVHDVDNTCWTSRTKERVRHYIGI